MKRLGRLGACLVATLATAACVTDDDPIDDDGSDDDVGEDMGEDAGAPCAPADDPVDESTCAPLDSDYQPADSDADPYPACISDGGTYELVSDPPGSIGRIEAMEQIADLLWRSSTAPSPEDFIAARTLYEADQGLGSRVDRREDLHYPPIPEAEWDPGLDADKQCSNEELAAAYPDRCAGPAKLRPLINQAFIDGIEGAGDPNVAAAKIEAGFLWFAAISTYKEAFTCTAAAKDCDSAWAYYTGGAQIGGAMQGLSKLVSEYSPNTHQRIFDGVLAVRCFRDLYSADDYPTYADIPAEGQALFEDAWEQLDDAVLRGFAVVVRQHALAQDDEQCSEAAAANWTFVQIAGAELLRETQERDPDAAATLETLLGYELGSSEDVEELALLLDTVFDCP